MASLDLDPGKRQTPAASKSDLRRRGVELVERLYGQRIRYCPDLRQAQLDGEPIPPDLFYLVLFRDHGIRMAKNIARDILLQVAHSNPHLPSAGAATDPCTPQEWLRPEPFAEEPNWLDHWMVQLRSMVQRI